MSCRSVLRGGSPRDFRDIREAEDQITQLGHQAKTRGADGLVLRHHEYVAEEAIDGRPEARRGRERRTIIAARDSGTNLRPALADLAEQRLLRRLAERAK